MHRRSFLKSMSAGSLGFILGTAACSFENPVKTKNLPKNWVWMRPQQDKSDDEYKALFGKMAESGIEAILPEIYNGTNARYNSKRHNIEFLGLEKILPLAKAQGLQVHGWMWSMPCNKPEIREKHPDWFAVNGKGEPAGSNPAYVDYYRFMCPNRKGVQEFVRGNLEELANISELDGLHLDYIRFPDVILAEALQPNYNIVQDREYPEYDYCYCDVCREKFKSQTGIDPLQLDDPSKNQDWVQFRYDSISNLVKNHLVPVARKYNKPITAAVFPNWKMVRQQWSTWGLDAVLPMLYNVFYNKSFDWIKHHTMIGIESLTPKTSYYSGLYIGDWTADELEMGIQAAHEGGAKGISIFSADAIKDDHWQVITKMCTE